MPRPMILALALATATPAFAYDWDFDAAHHIFVGDAGNGTFGIALSAGDVDGDGADDVVVGVPGEAAPYPGAGVVRVFLDGTDNTVFPAATVREFAANDAAGAAVEAGGDFNGDGYHDLAVGVPGSDCLSTHAYGITGTFAGAKLGSSVALVHDVSMDGLDDVLVGAPYYDDGLSDPYGNARVVLSSH